MLENFDSKVQELGLDSVKPVGPCWSWTVTDYGEGHIEALGIWGDVAYTQKRKINDSFESPETYDEFVMFLEREMRKKNKKADPANQESYERSIRRTKKVIRQKAMMLKVDRLLTCTTRAPIVDIEVFRDITTRFFRECRKRLDNFEYIAVFERHMSEKTSKEKYASLHLHVATKGFVHYNLLRQMWRKAVNDVLKTDDFSGANINVRVSNRNKANLFDRERIARYLSKYITKDITDDYEKGKKRYWSSRGIAKPDTYRIYTCPSLSLEPYRSVFSELFGIKVRKVFKPTVSVGGGVPPLIWLST